MDDAVDASREREGSETSAETTREEDSRANASMTPTGTARPMGDDGVDDDDDGRERARTTSPETLALGERLEALEEEAELTVESFLRVKFDAATTTSAAATTDAGSMSARSEGGRDDGRTGEDEVENESLYEPDTDLETAEEVDPRVGDALDELNDSMTECNALENELQQARKARGRAQQAAKDRLGALTKKLSSSVMTAVPVFHKRALARLYQARSIEALRAYETAHDAHERAKERNDALERDLVASSGKVDIDLMEACAEATREVTETAAMKARASEVHERNTRRAVEATTEAAGLERSRRGAVKKALPYFNAKTQGERECEDADERVRALKLSVRQAKARYDAALRALNEISEEVHARRQAHKRIDHDDHDDDVAIE